MSRSGKTSSPITAADLVQRARQRYAGRAFAVLEQVPNATGHACGSWIDVVVLSLWPSNGLWRAAFEIKVSRSDFIRELSKPNKNQWCRDRLHEFWFVAPADVIKEEELPEGAGWLKPRGDGLVVVRNASRRADVKTDDVFVAALARSINAERERLVRNATTEVLANSREHAEALAHRDALRAFVKERGKHSYATTVDDLVQELRDATVEAKTKADFEHAVRALNGFRDAMLRALGPFAQLCAYTILQRDAAGEHLYKVWGGKPDGHSLDAMRVALRGRKKRNWDARDRAEQVELADALLDGLIGEPRLARGGAGLNGDRHNGFGSRMSGAARLTHKAVCDTRRIADRQPREKVFAHAPTVSQWTCICGAPNAANKTQCRTCGEVRR